MKCWDRLIAQVDEPEQPDYRYTLRFYTTPEMLDDSATRLYPGRIIFMDDSWDAFGAEGS